MAQLVGIMNIGKAMFDNLVFKFFQFFRAFEISCIYNPDPDEDNIGACAYFAF
jgi:hypothetical protein